MSQKKSSAKRSTALTATEASSAPLPDYREAAERPINVASGDAGTAEPSTADYDLIGPLEKIRRLTDSLLRYLRRPSAATPDIARDARQLSAAIESVIASGSLKAVSEAASVAVQTTLDELPLRLKQVCEERQWPLWGAYPDFIVAGIVFFGVEERLFRVRLNDEVLPLLPFDAVVDRVVKEISSLNKGGFRPDLFVDRLWLAYQSCRARQKSLQEDGTSIRVSIYQILQEMAFQTQTKAFCLNPNKDNFRSYSQHSFRADLYRLLSEGFPEVRGHRLILEPTSVAENGLFMYLPTAGRCGFVGHVAFAPVLENHAD